MNNQVEIAVSSCLFLTGGSIAEICGAGRIFESSVYVLVEAIYLLSNH